MIKRLLCVTAGLFGTMAFAQGNVGNTGDITLRGNVVRTVSMNNPTAVYVAPGSGPAALNPATTSPTAFDIDWDFGNINLLTPSDLATAGSSVRVRLGFELRSNDSYTLTAQAVDNIAAPGSIIPASAIGFCTAGITEASPNSRVNAAHAETLAFDCTATANGTYDAVADTVTYGIGGLDDISNPVTPTTVITGTAISTGGTNNSPNNFLLVEHEFAFRPELFLSQGNFSYTITFTASSP